MTMTKGLLASTTALLTIISAMPLLARGNAPATDTPSQGAAPVEAEVDIGDITFGSLLDLIDVDRVEILRGPQGTLAGKNSIGGAEKMFSKLPTDGRGYVVGVSTRTLQRRLPRHLTARYWA